MNKHALLIAEAFNTPHLFEPTYAANVFQIATQRVGAEFSHGLPTDLYGGETEKLIRDHQSYIMDQRDEPRRSGARWYRLEGAEHIGVIPIVGSMIHRGSGFASMDRTYSSIEADYLDLMSDKKTRSVVIEMDSPGGTVAGGFSAFEFFRENKIKPVDVLVNERMLSGGLLLGSFADSVTVLKTSAVGSLGVIATHLNVEKQMEMEGVKATMIFSGSHKADGHPYSDLPDSVLSRIKSDLDETRQMFAESVSDGTRERVDGRQVSVDELMSQEAAIYRGQRAVEAGLATDVTTSTQSYYRAISQKAGTARMSQNAQPLMMDEDEETSKGEEGAPGNGARARRSIRSLRDKGYTDEEIGNETNRSASTIGQVARGEIENPPDDLVDGLEQMDRERSDKSDSDMKNRAALRAELKAEIAEEARLEAQLKEDRRIQAEAAVIQRKENINGHELAKLRPKLAAKLIADENMSADEAIRVMSYTNPEVTAPNAAATGSVIDDLGQSINQPGIGASHVKDTGGAEGDEGNADDESQYALVMGFVEGEHGADSAHFKSMDGYAKMAIEKDRAVGTSISTAENFGEQK